MRNFAQFWTDDHRIEAVSKVLFSFSPLRNQRRCIMVIIGGQSYSQIAMPIAAEYRV